MNLQESDLVLLAKLANPPVKFRGIIANFGTEIQKVKDLRQTLNWKEGTKEAFLRLRDAGFIQYKKPLLTDEGRTYVAAVQKRFDTLKKGIPLDQRKRLYPDDLFNMNWWASFINGQSYCGTRSILIAGKALKRIRDTAIELDQAKKQILADKIKKFKSETAWAIVKPVLFQVPVLGGFRLIQFASPSSKKPVVAIQATYFDFLSRVAGDKNFVYETTVAKTVLRVSYKEKILAYVLPVKKKEA